PVVEVAAVQLAEEVAAEPRVEPQHDRRPPRGRRPRIAPVPGGEQRVVEGGRRDPEHRLLARRRLIGALPLPARPAGTGGVVRGHPGTVRLPRLGREPDADHLERAPPPLRSGALPLPRAPLPPGPSALPHLLLLPLPLLRLGGLRPLLGAPLAAGLHLP